MARSLCHLLMKVNYVIVANFYVTNMSFNAIRENKIISKISEFTVVGHVGLGTTWLQNLKTDYFETWPRAYKNFFMLNPTEHEIYHAHKC